MSNDEKGSVRGNKKRRRHETMWRVSKGKQWYYSAIKGVVKGSEQ